MKLHSADGLVNAKVGVRYFPATETHPPLRILFPLGKDAHGDARPFRWLQERGVAYYLEGYARMAMNRTTWLFLCPLVHLLSWILPVQYLQLPNVYSFDDDSKQLDLQNGLPAIVFSHGLTGTGQENAALLASWAAAGFVVVSVHHTDGSSSRVRLANGRDLYYKRGPAFECYDANFRPNQLEHRAKEILQVFDFVRKQTPCSQIAVSGFSYGAATALRAMSMALEQKDPKDGLFCATVLLDGWFYIDVSESAGIEFPFPKQAFEEEQDSTENVPSIFVNSEQFSNIPKLYKATCQLANKQHANIHVILGAGHQNFCDVVFWVPDFVLRRMFPTAIGSKNATAAYHEIVNLTTEFLTKHFKKRQ